MKILKLTSSAFTPTRATEFAAGVDLYSPKDAIVKAGDLLRLEIDIEVQLPPGVYGRIAARSSMALNMLTVLGGVIDSDYPGNISVVLFNLGKEEYNIKKGDRVAQMILEKFECSNIEVVEKITREETINPRESKLGSTGK